ncbi:MAG TPA: nuclear transport factor 2 family protein [Acidimicrobiales bacterium]|nr:nuclear transport factor 2 family protein [Acidimicrobiales bacterium]
MAGDDGLAAEVERLGRRLNLLEATFAIEQLKAVYANLLDSRYVRGELVEPALLERLAGQVAELFTEDAVWDGGRALGVATGRQAIAERLGTPTLDFARHIFVKPRITVDGIHAEARWDVLCPCRTLDRRSWWMCGYEDDEYRLEDGRWLQSRMTLTTLVMAPVGAGFDRIFG